MYLDQAKAAFSRSHLAAHDAFRQHEEMHVRYLDGKKPEAVVRGCTDEEVATLEQRIGRFLPAAYREFLLWIGHSAEYLLRGSNVFYPDLERLHTSTEELLQENNITTPLPDDAFVFYMHQGYQCSFFRLSEGDNPPVYFYGEGEGLDTFRLGYPHYSDFLEAEIRDYLTIATSIAESMERRRKTDRPKS